MTSALGQVTPPVGMGTYQDWLVAWKEWARTRKRGKMAQFIVDKLEETKQARWLSISEGKFELTDWHDIAKEWFKEKPRNSDQVDAPCMLRKGLPRAFPGLDEVKSESIKEGTQYRSRVFMAPPELVQEVMMYIQNDRRMPGHMGAISSSGFHVPNTSLPYHPYTHQMTPYTMSNSQVQSPPLPLMNGGATSHMYGGSVFSTSGNPPIKIEGDHSFMVDSPVPSETQSPYYISPQAGPFISTSQASGPLDPSIDQLADAIVANHSPGSHSIYSEGPSPYSGDGSSPYQQQPQPSHDVLQLPGPGDEDWINPGGSGSHQTSPRYSPDPSEMVPGGGAVFSSVNPMVMPMNPQPPSAGPMSAAVPSPPLQPPISSLNLKVVPDSSPLEGGGQMVLVFYNELPPGNKFVMFFSRKRNNSITVETTQENPMVLHALVPRHDIPETVLLQVYCEGRVLAQSEFTYFANTQYHSDQLYQYLVQNMPQYFQMDDISGGAMGGMGMGGGGAGGGGGGAYGYYGNIPASTYGLLLGACRLGLEPLVYHTLQIKSMSKINGEQLQKAYSCSQEHGHQNLANCLKHLVRFASFVTRDSSVDTVLGESSKKVLEKLNNGGDDPLETSHLILKSMVEVSKLAKSPSPSPSPSPSHSPASHSPLHASSSTSSLPSPPQPSRRVSTTTKLQKQDSVKDPDEDLVEIQAEGKESAAPSGVGVLGSDGGDREKLVPRSVMPPHSSVEQELKDSLQPLPRERLSMRSSSRKNRLLATQSDDNDSAVSMSFDRSIEDQDLQREIERRMSGSFASSGLFSLNMSDTDKAVDVTIDRAVSYGFAHSLQYEGVFLVTEDYPPGEETIFRSGDRILAVGDTSVRGMSPDDFQELLEKETGSSASTKVKVLPRMERPPSSLSLQCLGSSLEVPEKKLHRRQSEKQMLDSITLKVSNLLSMTSSGKPRSVTITSSSEGFGFKVIGGNAVGLFVSEVKPVRKELSQGDQILEINGEDSRHMTHFEATQLLRSCRDKVHLTVMENGAKFTTIRDQFEFDSFYMRCLGDHKDISLRPNTIIRVVNTFLYSGHFWLAWIVDENGTDCELRKIPSPSKAKQQYGKDAYEEVESPSMSLSPSGNSHLLQPTAA